MTKKTITCPEYNILVKENEENLSVFVNGELFASIEELSLDDLDEEKLTTFIFNNYEKWGSLNSLQLNKFDFMKDGATCAESRSR